MLRAMYSGISGLKVNQEKLDVVGNNIANSSTTAYKSQRMAFQDALSQNVAEATGPSANVGGTNPSQVGLGVQVGSIDSDMTEGSLQPTNRNLDFAVDGNGYFIVGNGKLSDKVTLLAPNDENAPNTIDSANSTMQISYTRDGAFKRDYDGNLLTTNGYRVMGYALSDGTNTSISYDDEGKVTYGIADGSDDSKLKAAGDADTNVLIPLKIPDSLPTADGKSVMVKSFSVDANGVIKASLANGGTAALGQIAMTSFKNPEGLNKEGKNLLQSTANSGAAVFRTPVGTGTDNNPNDKAFGAIRQNKLEMSNVDLAEQFTDMITASRSFQANGKIITTSDEILESLVNLKR